MELTDAAKGWLADKGYDPAYGARPLRRAIQRYLESPLSQKLLEGVFAAGETILVDVAADETALTFSKKEESPAAQVSEEEQITV